MIAANAIRSHWFGRTRRAVEEGLKSMGIGDFRLARDEEGKAACGQADARNRTDSPDAEAIEKLCSAPRDRKCSHRRTI